MRIEIATDYFPRLTRWHVRRVLRRIEPDDLKGVDFIRLMDENPAVADARKKSADIWSLAYHGLYVKKNKQMATHINLYTRDLYLGIPFLLKFTPVATLRIAFTLAHEVGHHLVTSRRYIYDPLEKYKAYGVYNEYEEKMCDLYAQNLTNRMTARWSYAIGRAVSRRLSKWYLEYGAIDWEKQDYRRAAYYWFCAYCINPDNLDAAGWYKKAIEMLNNPEYKKPH